MRRLDLAVAITAVILLAAIAATIVIAARQHQPIGADDPGVAACRQLAGGDQGADRTWTEGDYRRARGQFAASKDPGLRTHGVTIMDITWAHRDDTAPLTMAAWQELTAAVAGLTAACANHGVELPRMIQERQ